MKPIFLIGFMGSGKSTIGKLLSHSNNLTYVDTDQVFEEEFQMEIKDFFSLYGEEAFRVKEADVLRMCTKENYIISTGGGMVLREGNRRWMLERGIVVFLDASFEEVQKRLGNDSTRPLFSNVAVDETKNRYNQRQSLYEECHFKVRVDGKAPESIVKEICAFIEL